MINTQFPILQETVKLSTADVPSGTPINRFGVVTTGGNYAAGITMFDAGAGEHVTICSSGIASARVEIGATINVDSPVTTGSAGPLVVGVPGSDYILGYAIDSSSGSTPANPHKIRIKLA